MEKNSENRHVNPCRTQISYYLFLLSNFLPGYESQKFPYDSTVLHDSLHVDCLTVCKHLVTQPINWTIPDRERRKDAIKHYNHTT